MAVPKQFISLQKRPNAQITDADCATSAVWKLLVAS